MYIRFWLVEKRVDAMEARSSASRTRNYSSISILFYFASWIFQKVKGPACTFSRRVLIPLAE